jgi:hypothetical protein
MHLGIRAKAFAPALAMLAGRDREISLPTIHSGHQFRKFRLRHVPIPDPIDTALSRFGFSLRIDQAKSIEKWVDP